jgi:hypothetical protein
MLARRTRFVIAWAAIAAVHFAVTFILVIYLFGAGMARFDTAAPPTRVERLASLTVTVLAFPVLSGLSDLLPATVWPPGFPWDHLLFLVNSVVWATLLMAVWTWRQRPTRR